MLLSEKGRFAPPPRLRGRAAQQVSTTLASWDDVHARTHWLLGDETIVDGADFYVGDGELGHLHLDSDAHVFHTRAIVAALVERGLARPFAWGREIAVFEVRDASDVDHALWLFKLSYDRLRGTPVKALLERIATYAR